jgi:hypothetical protein
LDSIQGKPLREAFPNLTSQWEQDGTYASDSYHLLMQKKANTCLECHQISGQRPTPRKGPTLFFRKDLQLTRLVSKTAAPVDTEAYVVSERLRPEWVLRWIAQPTRLSGYDTIMIQQFDNFSDPKASMRGYLKEPRRIV